jgi:hypothetical protein
VKTFRFSLKMGTHGFLIQSIMPFAGPGQARRWRGVLTGNLIAGRRSDSMLDSFPVKNTLPSMDAERTGVSTLSGAIKPMLKTL